MNNLLGTVCWRRQDGRAGALVGIQYQCHSYKTCNRNQKQHPATHFVCTLTAANNHIL